MSPSRKQRKMILTPLLPEPEPPRNGFGQWLGGTFGGLRYLSSNLSPILILIAIAVAYMQYVGWIPASKAFVYEEIVVAGGPTQQGLIEVQIDIATGRVSTLRGIIRQLELQKDKAQTRSEKLQFEFDIEDRKQERASEQKKLDDLKAKRK